MSDNPWEDIYENCKTSLRYNALKLTKGRTYDAEELLQETFYRALRYCTNPEELRKPLAYLLRIMHNIWNTKQGKREDAITLSLDELLSQEDEERRVKFVEPSVDPVAERILEHKELWEEFKVVRGPLKERETFLIERHLQGYACDEIADEIGEDVRLTTSDLNAVRTKVRARIQSASEKQGKGED
jgi:DNA-directed RNA polymerase specialized sigma24 family protein